jgi:Uma2 family endonuclease
VNFAAQFARYVDAMSIDEDVWTRALIPGTSGWTSDCFTEPQFANDWASGRFEIIEGVLTRCVPVNLFGALALTRLLFLIRSAAKAQDVDCCPGVEVILNRYRVVRADAAFFTVYDFEQQEAAEKQFSDDDERRYRVLVPPTLVIESTTAGYERHNTHVKKRFYAEFGVPNYWILDRYHVSLDCFRLQDGKYALEKSGAGKEEITVSNPFAMTLPLSEVFRQHDES